MIEIYMKTADIEVLPVKVSEVEDHFAGLQEILRLVKVETDAGGEFLSMRAAGEFATSQVRTAEGGLIVFYF